MRWLFSEQMALPLLACISFCSSALFVLLLGPFCIRFLRAKKMGQPIRHEEKSPLLGQLHSIKQDTPTMGGILILAGMLFAALLCMDLSSPTSWLLLFVTLSVGAIGAYDDAMKLMRRHNCGLSPKLKMGLLLLIGTVVFTVLYWPSSSFAVSAARFYLPWSLAPLFTLKGVLLLLVLPWVLFVFSGSANAVNLTDGLDGLAAASVATTAAVLALFGLSVAFLFPGGSDAALYLAAMSGAAAAFLVYNRYPAKLFMGDTGSLTLGAVLATGALIMRCELLFAIAGALFVIETLSVMLQVWYFRRSGGKRILLCAPLHHHFEYMGWKETKVVTRLSILSGIAALAAVACFTRR